jgi:hypothetical protein
MTEEIKMESKQEAEKTATPESSTEEKKDSREEGETSQKNEDGEGRVTLTKEQFELLQKKAKDYEGIIEKKRIEKLKKDIPQKEEVKELVIDEDKIAELVDKKVNEVLQKQTVVSYEKNVEEAYRDFVKEHSWADDDERINKISEHFSPNGVASKEDLLARIKIAAQTAYPQEYSGAIEKKIKSKAMADDVTVSAGGAGIGDSIYKRAANNGQLTKEQIEMAKKCGNDPNVVYKK